MPQPVKGLPAGAVVRPISGVPQGAIVRPIGGGAVDDTPEAPQQSGLSKHGRWRTSRLLTSHWVTAQAPTS
jgi:hypothetical protein